ncbi:dimethyl sulfoxide reductase anchor subunit family protein [Arenimonas fontis]|uniref:DMSO reductase n=1 Tax=Arenimonas fontis TaxID=2608255 RepID=A0A5B2ZBU1_9GAMM|nr:DmsC/YnfH family molybdoenzyme membrane anchor subunit [Arenimonas fontis]KAA2284612.1 hypothetical protein F0415_07875 [Arenimonas fontis]
MHPSFSVIFFTTLSGLGYGLWIWSATALLHYGSQRGVHYLLPLALGVLPVTAGLLSSTLHLGRPLRAWRAFSQWRSSWLSREGVLAVLAFLPWAFVVGSALFGQGVPAWAMKTALVALVLLSLATLVCTAMIYASLKPIPAWRHWAVLPAYLGFALLTGGLAAVALYARSEWPGTLAQYGLPALALLLGGLKWRYWRDIDRGPLPAGRASALGLPAGREIRVFERPHTEANFITREMGFVLARKHGRRLRAIALLLFAGLPALLGLLAFLPASGPSAPLLGLAAGCALLGAIVERWLFFAQARHLVTLYY